MKKLFLLFLAVAMAFIAGSASAATVTISTTAPIVTTTDESNLVAQTGLLKWFHDIEHDAGQTFTPSEDLQLKSFTIRLGADNLDDGPDWLNLRLGTITRPGDVFTFTDIYSETANLGADQFAGDYLTFALDAPQTVTGGVEYGIILDAQNFGDWHVGIPYLSLGGTSYADGHAIGRGAPRGDDLVFHADLVNPLQPQPIEPQEGVTVPAGDVDLIWANIDPDNSNPLYIDVLFGTDPCSLALVVDGVEDATTVTVNAPVAGTYYWQVNSDIGEPSIIEGSLFVFYVIDSDGDGFPDEYELLYTDPPSPVDLIPGEDDDTDLLTNMEEYNLGTIPNNPDTDGDTLLDGPELVGVDLRPATDPLKADTDGDGYDDGVETNTGTYVDAFDTGTNPADADTDGDGLVDGVETNTGTFVDETDTGTDPFDADSDSDGAEDWYEVAAAYTDPANPADFPVIPYPLPDPDGSTGATDKPVKVYIMAGQSNMVGFGTINGDGPGRLNTMVNTENKFPNLVDGTGAWIARDDVMYRGVISCIGDDYLRPGFGADGSVIGPELGFGQVMGWYHDEPVLLIKSSIGNRSISWDYAPPSTPQFEYNGSIYAGYGESPNSWLVGEGPTPYVWYCGKQWDDCFLDEADMGAPGWTDATDYPVNCQVTNNGGIYISTAIHTSDPNTEPGVGVDSSANWNVYTVPVGNVVDVLDNFATEYPEYAGQGFEIAGYVWWQGHKDQSDPHAYRYELNMVNFINDIRDYYETRYPADTIADAPFVLATVAFDGGWDNTSPFFLAIADAQLAVEDPNDDYGFKGNVKTVEARGYWRDGSISPSTTGYHYNHNAETYMLVGDALGRAMIELDGSFAVNAGDDMVTWSGEPVALDATVQSGVTVSSYSWTAVSSDPGNTTIGFDSTIIEDPTITITKTGAEAVTVTVMFTVDDGENPPVSDTLEIEVYDDACQAARIGMELADDYPADIVGDDCITDIQDLAEMALNWLNVSGLSSPQHK